MKATAISPKDSTRVPMKKKREKRASPHDGPRFNNAESPLFWLRSRHDKDGAPIIDDAAFTAGERLRRDYTIAGLLPGITMNWDHFALPAASSASHHLGGRTILTDAALAARQRVERALKAVGPEFASLLVDVCCYLKGISEIERERLWPLRSGKIVLRLALAALARHYGLSSSANGPQRGKIRSFREEVIPLAVPRAKR